MPFGQLESALQGKTTTSIQKTKQNEESVVRKLMLDMWNQVSCIYIFIKVEFILPVRLVNFDISVFLRMLFAAAERHSRR